MSLLVDMMTNTLDEAYTERAARRQAAPGQDRPREAGVERSPATRLGPLVGLVVVGIVTGTAIAQVRERAAANEGLRTGLAVEVRERKSSSDDLAARAAVLRAEVEAARERALGADAAGRSASRRLAALGAASATTAVRGPGIVVTLDDAPTGDGAEQTALPAGAVPDGQVRDQDLQDVVNGLWAAGAEAIAVDDQRLAATSAIRSAGAAILVDLLPLNPPYVVEAIGDPARLEVAFGDGPSGRRLSTLASAYGVVFEIGRAETLTLPAASAPELRAASPVPVGPS